MSKSLRSKMRTEKFFNPFSDSFNFEKAVLTAKSILEDDSKEKERFLDDNNHAHSIVMNSDCFNEYFKILYDYMKEIIDASQAGVETILKYIIAFSNHDTMKIDDSFENYVKENLELKLEGIASLQIDNQNNPMGPSNAGSMYETQVDILNLLLNYLRYFIDDEKKHNNYNQSVLHENASKMYKASNIMYVIKNAYDTVLWQDGKIDREEDRLNLRPLNKDNEILRQIGNLRLLRNELANKIVIQQYITSKPKMLKNILKMRTDCYISNLEINSRGFISLSYKRGELPDYIIQSHLSAISPAVAFYPHLTDEKLEGIGDLKVNDLGILHAELVALGLNILNTLKETNPAEINGYNIRMKRKELIDYLLKVSGYKKSQVENYLSLVESDFTKEERINLWEKPLLKISGVYFFVLPALLHPNYLQLIDAWLDNAGFSLKSRGTALEIFIKDNLKKKLQNKGDFIIPKDSIFSITKKNFEEIDLIISFDNLIILGEIKNIKYPMEARDHHNALKRLTEGAEQIARKKGFLLKHKEKFAESLNGIDGKEVICVIITNYTHFTGVSIEGIPVIDYMAFQNYMDEGFITNSKTVLEEGEFLTEEIEKIYLWRSENEFFENLKAYLYNPNIIDVLRPNVKMVERKISLDTFNPEIYLQYADLISE